MQKTKIVFLLQPQSNLLDLGGAAHTFLEAQEHGLDIEILFCSFENNIKSNVGLSFGKLLPFNKLKLQAGDYLFVLSTSIQYILSTKYIQPKGLMQWIKEAYVNKVNICAICNGAFLLAKTGLLNYTKCTTHWKRTKELQVMYPLANVQENLIFVDDKNIITSAGGTSGVDVALYILSKIKDSYFTYKIARELVVYQRRNGNDEQLSTYVENRSHLHTGIHKVQDHIHTNITKKINLLELADIANMSYRNFCRVFKKETSVSANQYINLIRKEKAVQLQQNADLTKKQIANKVGLQSERQLSRILYN